jgi:hypothetical protein
MCDGARNCRIKHDRGFCRARELFVLPRLVFVRPYGVCTRLRCVEQQRCSVGRMMYAQLPLDSHV